MPSSLEIRVNQKRMLHQLLMIKENPDKLAEYINITKTEMEAEDVAYVEKMVEELKR